jgi:serine/threonine-protein kinase
MLTGRHVFAGSSAIEIYAAHLHTAPAPPRVLLGRAVSPELEAVLLRGLSKSPSDRPASAAAFREALLRCEVPPWTPEDARAWWRTQGERARRREGAAPGSSLSDAPTVTIVRDRVLPGA